MLRMKFEVDAVDIALKSTVPVKAAVTNAYNLLRMVATSCLPIDRGRVMHARRRYPHVGRIQSETLE
jgi:hypothetical protein